MYDIIDPSTPRYQLPFEELPRGFVPWPQVYVDHLKRHEAQSRFGRYAEGYRITTLTNCTLRHYYEGYHVAYRPAEGGVEVLAVGYPAVESYLKDPTCKVVQA